MDKKSVLKTLTKYIGKQLEKHEKSLDKILSKSPKRSYTQEVITRFNIKIAKEDGAIQSYKKVIDFVEKNL